MRRKGHTVIEKSSSLVGLIKRSPEFHGKFVENIHRELLNSSPAILSRVLQSVFLRDRFAMRKLN